MKLSILFKYVLYSKGLECGNCVLQWRYIAGNNWGMCDNGTGKLNCNQISFLFHTQLESNFPFSLNWIRIELKENQNNDQSENDSHFEKKN